MRVLITDGMEKESVEKIKALGAEVVEKFYSPEELKEVIGDFDVLVVRSATKVRKDLIDVMKDKDSVKLIIRGGVGTDNIDVDYACEQGILVRNTPNASSDTVAEFVIASIFALARNLHKSNVTMRRDEWNKKEYKGIEIAGKTLGIVGFGRIGRCLGKKAEALGMKVCYTDLTGVCPTFPQFDCLDLEELLERSDFVSVHISGANCEVIGKDQFKLMKKGSYIINTARGTVVNSDALLEAIEDGIISGAALDVFPVEPCTDERLLQNPKISLTPHIAGSTDEAQTKIGDEVAEIIKEFAEKEFVNGDYKTV